MTSHRLVDLPRTLTGLALFAAMATWLAQPANAQTATAPNAIAPTATASDAVTPTAAGTAKIGADGAVELNPFMVEGTESGYRATNSMVATGFNRDVEHTPLTINIVTEDFIRDAGLTSYADVGGYLPNTYVVPDVYGLGSTANARGQGTSYYTQDGMRYYTEPIVRTGGRVEVIKGPATLFFGRAQPGGIFNFGTRGTSPIRENTVTLTGTTQDQFALDVGSQGKIDTKGKLTYRLDATMMNNKTFVDEGYDRLKFVRAALSYKIIPSLIVNLNYSYSDRKQSGLPGAESIISPQYYADYKQPRQEQINWARTQAGLGSLTDAQLADVLRGQWKENLVNWIVQTRLAYYGKDPKNPDDLYPVYATGLTADNTPRGWKYNAAGYGSYAEKIIYDRGADVVWTPSTHLAIKAQYQKYNLTRPRLTNTLSDLLADSTFRSASLQVREDQNDSYTMNLTALGDYNVGPTHNTTNIGAQRFRDFYRNTNGVFYGLNAAPNVAKDPRLSSTTVVAAGYNPFTDPYPDISRLVQLYPNQVARPVFTRNYEDAIYASHIVELFDRKVGILVGGRIQTYEVENPPKFENTANLQDINTFGISWEARPNLVFFTSRSKSFEPNINSYLVDGAGATQAEKDANPAPPVSGLGYDLGVKFGFMERKLVGSISAFQVERNNDAAFRTTDVGRTNADPRNNDADQNNNVTYYIPGGNRRSRGIDFELSYTPNRNYSAVFTAGWLPEAKVIENKTIPIITTADGRRIADPNIGNFVGQRSPNSPKATLSFWNHYLFPQFPGFGAGIGANYVARTEVPQIRSYQVTLPSYVNVRAGIDYTKKLRSGLMRLSLTVANLLDDRYFIGGYRGDPLTVTGRATYSF